MGRVIVGAYNNRFVMKKENTTRIMTFCRIPLDSRTIQDWDITIESGDKSALSMAGRGLAGAFLAGPAGALIGAATTKSDGAFVAVHFKNGKTSLIQLEKELFAVFKFNFTNPSTKSRFILLFLCLFLGIFGFHRFYVGKYFTGLLMLLTLGLAGALWLIDLIMVLCRDFTDSEGRIV